MNSFSLVFELPIIIHAFNDGGRLMAYIKFGDHERHGVILRLEAWKRIKLTPVRNYKKFLKGSDGSYYCIVGGSGDWHGIPKEVMEHGKKDSSNFYLVIARLLKTKIQIYVGSLKPLVDWRASLTRTKEGDFQFDLKTPTDETLSIKQVPGAKFSKVAEFVDNVSLFKQLSKEQQHDLLAKYGSN